MRLILKSLVVCIEKNAEDKSFLYSSAITDQQHYKRDKVYHEDRMKYGVCQAIWASMQENEAW